LAEFPAVSAMFAGFGGAVIPFAGSIRFTNG
jgi:hypothetical protein